jgi:hypothetical protein
MAVAAFAPVLPNQKKSVAKSPDSLTHPVSEHPFYFTFYLFYFLVECSNLQFKGFDDREVK